MKARAIPYPHQPPSRGDNTVSVAQGGTATPGATKQLLPPDRVLRESYIYIYIYILWLLPVSLTSWTTFVTSRYNWTGLLCWLSRYSTFKIKPLEWFYLKFTTSKIIMSTQYPLVYKHLVMLNSVILNFTKIYLINSILTGDDYNFNWRLLIIISQMFFFYLILIRTISVDVRYIYTHAHAHLGRSISKGNFLISKTFFFQNFFNKCKFCIVCNRFIALPVCCWLPYRSDVIV